MTKEYTANTDNVVVVSHPVSHAFPWTVRLSNDGMDALAELVRSAPYRESDTMKNEVRKAIWAEWDKEEIA